MLGQLLVGTGVVVSGIRLANVKCFFQGTCASPNTVIANFFSTLEAGIVIAGVRIMIVGIGMLLESMHR